MRDTDLGAIYWLGTGPGDPGLITVKALSLVQEADAIVCDALGVGRLLKSARADVEIIDVGSRGAGNKMPQARVNEALVDAARRHNLVLRLWQGDPFVFGRAAQEMAIARQAGIKTALVPGVSSAIAVPGYAGVPLTHWDYTAAFAVVTGFLPDKIPVEPNWQALAQLETLVILMPLENLPEIIERLLAFGRPADTPVLLVQHGTTPLQKKVVTTLDSLVEVARQQSFEEPSIMMTGPLVNLSTQLDWFQPADFPLLGQRVLVTRPLHQAGDFVAELRNLGAEPITFPTIEIKPVADSAELDGAIRRLGDWAAAQRAGDMASLEKPFDWLVLTSVNGVSAFFERLFALGFDSRALASVKIAAIGPATAAALARRSVKPDLVPAVYTAEGVLEAFDSLGAVAGQRFLLARADIARRTLAVGLEERGVVVTEIPAYRTVPVENGTYPPQADIVTFTSSSTVQGYVNCLGQESPAEALGNSQVVCIGPITANTARELRVPVSAVAEKYTIDGILDVLQGGEV